MDDGLTIAALAEPLANGVGDDLRAGGAGAELFLAVKDARAAARRAERDALAMTDDEVAPLAAGLRAWGEVATTGAMLLAERSKDLQLAAWMTEAWLRRDGFPGLAAGFLLMAELVDAFWDDGLYPREDEDGVETRVSALFGLFGREEPGTLVQPIKLLPLSDANGTSVALWAMENVVARSTRHDDPETRDELTERRRVDLAALEDAIARGSRAFLVAQAEAIEAALAALDRLMAAIDARTPFGRFGSKIARPLEDALALLRPHLPAAAPLAEQVEPLPDDDTVDEGARPMAGTRVAPGSRAAALSQLGEVADFFDRTEPQSLTAKSLRDVVRRANLPIDALLAELLPEAEQRNQFLLRAGIRSVPADDGYSSY